MYTAHFTFESEKPIGKVITELLAETYGYDRVKMFETDGEEFEAHYVFEESHDGVTIGIGNGYIDSTEADEDY